MKYEIKKNMSMPSERACMANRKRFGLLGTICEMEVGDMVLVPVDADKPEYEWARKQGIAAAAGRNAQKTVGPRKFATRRLPEGIGIWRVE